MATKETVDLGEAHAPREGSIKVFNDIEHELRKQLIHLRHDHDKHDNPSFRAARHVSDHDLAAFDVADFVQVRVALSAYGIILFGKLRLPALAALTDTAYVHFRAFSEGADQEASFHSFYTQETDDPDDLDGDGHRRTYATLFTADEPLDWFDA